MKRSEVILLIGFAALAGVLIWQQLSTQKMLLAQAESAKAEPVVVAEATPEAKVTPLEQAAINAVTLSEMSNPDIRGSAASIMGHLGTPISEDRLLVMANSDADLQVRGAAMEALIRMKSRKMGPLLLQTIREGDDLQKQLAAKTLASLAPRDQVADVLPLIPMFRSNSGRNQQVRAYLVDYLRKTADPGACEPLLELLKQEADITNRYQIALAMKSCATRSHGLLLAQAVKACPPNPQNLSSHDPLVPLIEAMAAVGDPRTVEVVLPLVSARNTFVQRAVLEYLVAVQDPMAAHTLVDVFDGLGSYNQGFIRQAAMDGYPGLVLAEDERTVTTAPEELMQEAMKEREVKLALFMETIAN